ncbi:ankyrin repeat: SAM and basic leucine zipper domain-containing protein 1-like protein, partial [Leptotrombidium deliense]
MNELVAQEINDAVFKDNVDLLDNIMSRGVDINAVYSDYEKALHIAIKYTAVGCVHYLLENNIKINLRNSFGNTELMSILGLYNNEKIDKIIEMLINAPDLNFEQTHDKFGWNYLHFACYSGCVKLVKKLATKFQHFYAADNKGKYLLHIVAERDFTEVIIAL